MTALSCHCGEVSIRIARRPDFLHDCNCSLCRKSGAWWAYLDPAEVTVSGATQGYSRTDKADPSAEVQFCAHCGVTTHFVLTEAAAAKYGNSMLGVNMRLAEPATLGGLELRYPDGRAWSGAGEFGYVQPPRVLGPGPLTP